MILSPVTMCGEVLAKHLLFDVLFDGKVLFKELFVLELHNISDFFFQPPAQTCLKSVSVF